MGYTHYWDHKEIAPETWAKITEKCKKIVEKVEVNLDEVQITKERIWFNGIGDDAHETFVVNRGGTEFEFCKTARKPYDLPVCMCLLAIKEEFPDFCFRSDGSWMDEWQKPREEYKKIFGGYPPSWDHRSALG